MNITIAGYGFVGRAQNLILERENNITFYDPFKGYTEFPEDTEALIICVATPPHKDGSCNVNNVFSVLSHVTSDVPVLIKSTISLEGWEEIMETYGDYNISFSPEFLREKTWEQDALSQSNMLIGGTDCFFWYNIYSQRLNKLSLTVKPVPELILAKYAINSFLATKVVWFDQLYELCHNTGINYDSLRDVVSSDSRIGDSHTYVYLEDRGFGGHCFPKDTSAFIKTAKKYGVSLSILEEAISYNNNLS